MRILERDRELEELAGAARAAALGRGSVVLVSGEAGIGKTSLVRAMRHRVPAEGRVLVGQCDALATARILGPFRDLAGSVGHELDAALRDGDRDRILTGLLSELDRVGHPTVLVIEDVHWADDATLDVLRFLVRRVPALPVVVMLTYRDDEIGRDHPLLHLLGVAAGAARRLPLRRLSAEAVHQLSAGGGVDADEVYAITSGNPFFVSEVLASGAESVSRTVVDAVLARLVRLGQATRQAVEQLSVIPTAIDRWLADALVPGGLAALAEAEERGLLAVTRSRISFRHELTRRAITDALPATRRTELNARVLAALVASPDADVARIVHHAVEAGDEEAIIRYGPLAARGAAAGGSHREAVAHYELVLGHQAAFAESERVDLLAGYALECHIVGKSGLAASAQETAIELWRALGDERGLVRGLLELSRMHWWNGDRLASDRRAAEALQIAERVGDTPLLALACSHRAVLDGMAYRADSASRYGERALELARAAGDRSVLPHTLTGLRMARWHDDAGAEALVLRGRRIAEQAGDTGDACNAYLNTAMGLLERYRLDLAAQCIEVGVELAERIEQVGQLDALYVQRARLQMLRGEWDESLRTLAPAHLGRTAVVSAKLALRGRILARRGLWQDTTDLAEAVRLAGGMGEVQFLAPAQVAAVEAAWLRGDPDSAAFGAARAVYDEVVSLDADVLSGELGYWLSRAGLALEPRGEQTPYGWLAAGRWQQAASEWRRLGCRYEHALALSHSPSTDDLLVAFAELDALGAAPLAGVVRRRLRELGVERVPRGRTLSTRQNRAGLTKRQTEVLELVAAGLSNPEIADRLVLSVRTAGNHVAAILDKLGVNSRADAVARAQALGILPPD